VSRPVDNEDDDEAVEDAALCWDEETLVLTETPVELDELDEVEVKKVVLAAAAGEEVEGTAEDEGSAREGAPSAQTRVPFLMPSRTSASETMLPLSEYMTMVGPATKTSTFSVAVASRFISWWC
jgi:hypothetical protein